MNLTNDQLHTLRHMLGINDPYARIPKPYRNYAAVNPGDKQFAALEAVGAVERYEARDTTYHYYRCTDVGRAAAMRSHRAIRKSKAQRVYARFLDVRDAWPDVTFRTFLTHPDFAQTRKDA